MSEQAPHVVLDEAIRLVDEVFIYCHDEEVERLLYDAVGVLAVARRRLKAREAGRA
jgi:hypothetical protein